MAEFRANEDGSVVKVELVEQETSIDVAALEARESELASQLDELRNRVAELEAQHGEVKSDLEGARAVVPASEEVANEESDESVDNADEAPSEETPQF